MTQPPSSPDHATTLLAQYTAYIQDLGNIGVRHENTRTFYLSVLSAVIAFLALAGKDAPLRGVAVEVQVIVAIAGFLIGLAWFFHMRVFGRLYLAKFKTLRRMEKDGTSLFPLYATEWEELRKLDSPNEKDESQTRRYRGLVFIDEILPLALASALLLVFGMHLGY